MICAEPDGVFCVFAKGVCSLSLSANLKAAPLTLRYDYVLPELNSAHKKTRQPPGFH